MGGAVCACTAFGTIAEAQQGDVICSVLSGEPCAPTVCSPLSGVPCQPQYPFPLGQTLQLTVNSTQSKQGEPVDPDHPIDTIRELFAALRACWQPPDATHHGMQMSVRFAFKRTGEVIAEPRVTYTTPGIDHDTRQVYRHAITQALDRCTPVPFSKGMGGAIAGRPIAIRYVDNRDTADREHAKDAPDRARTKDAPDPEHATDAPDREHAKDAPDREHAK